jgi:S-DNA-T family DNA segregation ATPase FtsK/SpoIIIE
MIENKLESFIVETFRNIENLLRSIDSRLQSIDENLSTLASIESKLDGIESHLPKESEKKLDEEEIILNCIEVLRNEQKASVWLLQRRLQLDYDHAVQIMNELERRGIVGPDKGEELREIKL